MDGVSLVLKRQRCSAQTLFHLNDQLADGARVHVELKVPERSKDRTRAVKDLSSEHFASKNGHCFTP